MSGSHRTSSVAVWAEDGLGRWQPVAELIECVTLAVEARASPMGSFLCVFHRVVLATGSLRDLLLLSIAGAISPCYGAGGTLWVS